jgi:hypothetical protein
MSTVAGDDDFGDMAWLSGAAWGNGGGEGLQQGAGEEGMSVSGFMCARLRAPSGTLLF